MKKTSLSLPYLIIYLVLLAIITNNTHAQSRTAGQAVVPKGWENEDSVRFGLFDIAGSAVFSGAKSQTDSLADELQATFEHSFGAFPLWESFVGKRKGFMGYGIRTNSYEDATNNLGWCDFSNLAYTFKQRVYYPSPSRIGYMFDPGYFWRYIDTAGYSWHHNKFDENDISPYAEFDKRPSIVAEDLVTKRFTGSDSTVKYGNEGKVILGYSDNRFANQLLRTYQYYQFPVSGNSYDVAGLFSARLEFAIDVSDIDTSYSLGVSPNDLPLLRVQVAFKKAGQTVLPFVPFKTHTDSSNAGWFIIADEALSANRYNTLYDSWRAEDTLEGGAKARSWKFKQLHIPLTNMPASMKNLILPADTLWNGIPKLKESYGTGSGKVLISERYHPDTLVKHSASIFSIDSNFIEVRVLSTYRAKVRVRSLCWQDTISDKFFYRRMFGDTAVHSCNPDGTYGGYDDSVTKYANLWADSLGSRRPREILINDTPPEFSALSSSACGYLDYLLSKKNIHLHIREQESQTSGDWSLHFRRERMSHNGEPPSVYENQTADFYSDRFKNWYSWLGSGPKDIVPCDYLINGRSLDFSQSWPSAQDSMVGLIIGRPIQNGSDTLTAYRRYTDLYGGLNVLSSGYRISAKFALDHPKNKRSALEISPQGWGIIKVLINEGGVISFDPHYNQRPTTPEETQVQFYVGLANGATAFNQAQSYDYGNKGGGAPGSFGIQFKSDTTTPFRFVHNYNFGHRRSRWARSHDWIRGTNNELDTGITDYYLGYANTYNSIKKTLSRINQIYDTNGYNKNFPFKRLEWIGAYSAHKGIPGSTDSTDRSTYLGSFIRAFCTTPVKRWERTAINGYQQYIDSTDGGGNLVPDSAHRTYVEVGLFRDNPGDTLKGYAAMVVNTRLWPSLRDAEDSIYYNQGLDSAKDRSRSTLGDIDTRKAWFKLDTIAFPPSFRSSYYVIRDVWHHDTTYLVHCDSGFGVYMKPGEARLLYIEKDISIRTAPKAATAVNEFGFNNGRRVAEILRGRQSVVTYTRAGKLYVNYPGAGERFEGYNERSAGENIATGYELCIDSSGTCHRPSICAGMNDTAVAITYWSSELGGRVKVAYQKKPYDPWIFATATDLIPDTTSDHSGVTPVIAPYASLTQFHPIDSSHLVVFKDSIWLVAASYLNQGSKATGIICLRFKVNASGIQYLDDTPDQFFHFDGVTPVLSDRSAFPTITSRALHYIHDNPIRLAWQKSGKIFYNQYKDTSLVLTPAGAPECISDGLPSLCYNYHPSIAMNCVKVLPSTGIKGYDGSGQTAQTKSGPTPDTNIYMHDYVVWESKLNGKKWNSGTHFWPVLRSRYEKLEWMRPNPAKWNSFQVFKPKIDTTNFHWPVVSAGSRVDTFLFGSSYARNLKAYHERLRIAWFDDAVDSMEFVHYPNSIKRTILNEGGTRPSLPQPTYYIKRMSDSSMIQPSVAFMGLQKDDSLNHVRITNGWFPMVSTAKKALIFPSIQIIIKADTITKCPQVVKKIDIGPPSIIKTGGGTPQVNWKPTDVGGDLGIFPNDWPLVPTNPVEFSSDTFRVTALDSIIVPRKLDSLDITSLRNGLYDNSDYYIQKILLKRHLDSSYVGTVDSIFISKTAARYPGNGLHPTFAKYEHPLGMPTDSVFLSIEVLRGNTANLLERGFTEYIQDDDIATMAFKQAPDAPAENIREEQIPITMEIYPNPLSLNATVEVVTPDGVQTLIELYDINGKRISTLFDGSSSGKLTLTLEGKDLTNGIYFIRTQCGNSVVTKKVELIK